MKNCVLCGQPLKEIGHNPQPLKRRGTCCSICNYTDVVPARLRAIYKDYTYPPGPYKCPVEKCGQVFQTLGGWKEHVLHEHYKFVVTMFYRLALAPLKRARKGLDKAVPRDKIVDTFAFYMGVNGDLTARKGRGV